MELPDFLTRLPDGNIVLTGRRIRLYDVVLDFHEGRTPEMIALEYAPLPLAVAYKVIGFYLDNKAEVDEYVRLAQDEMDRLRATGHQLDVETLRQRMEAVRQGQTRAGA